MPATYFWTSTSSTDWNTGANWTKSDGTTGAVPGSGDTVFVVPIPGVTLASISFNDQSAVTLAALTVTAAISIGTASDAVADFYGYLKISATLLTIGGEPTRVKINLGTAQSAITITGSGNTSDNGAATIRLLGTHASNTLNVSGGADVGVATNLPTEVSTILTTNVSGAQTRVEFGVVTSTTVNAADSSTFTAGKPPVTVTTSKSATATINGLGIVTTATANVGSTINLNSRPASGDLVTTAYAYGKIDYSGNPSAGVVATQYVDGPTGSIGISAANPAHITFTARNFRNCSLILAK